MKDISRISCTTFAWIALVAVPDSAVAQRYGSAPLHEVSARVWFDRGYEPLLERGDRARIYYTTDRDAYVAIFQIDTNGTTRLVFPSSPTDRHYVRGGRDYRLVVRGGGSWYVNDEPGLGYFFIVASPVPFDFSYFHYTHFGRSWDLSQVGRTVYSDPYVAMDEYVAALIPDWDRIPYALDFATYHVGRQRYDFPRFVCYDCHGFTSYGSWNPYLYSCASFRVVIFDDPYYYPSTRYRGDRVVYVRPPTTYQPRFAFKERAQNEGASPLITRRDAAPPLVEPSSRPNTTRRAVPRSGGQLGREEAVAPTPGRPSGQRGSWPTNRRTWPGDRPSAQGGAPPSGSPTSARPTTRPRPTGEGTARPARPTGGARTGSPTSRVAPQGARTLPSSRPGGGRALPPGATGSSRSTTPSGRAVPPRGQTPPTGTRSVPSRVSPPVSSGTTGRPTLRVRPRTGTVKPGGVTSSSTRPTAKPKVTGRGSPGSGSSARPGGPPKPKPPPRGGRGPGG